MIGKQIFPPMAKCVEGKMVESRCIKKQERVVFVEWKENKK